MNIAGGPVFVGCTLRPVSPAGPDPRRAILADARYGGRVRGVDFSGAGLDTVAMAGLVFVERCTFVGADLRHATLDRCCFLLCDLRGADLRGAALRGARFSACDLSGADLRGADLYDAEFGCVGAGDGATPTVLVGTRFDRGALRAEAIRDGVVPP